MEQLALVGGEPAADLLGVVSREKRLELFDKAPDLPHHLQGRPVLPIPFLNLLWREHLCLDPAQRIPEPLEVNRRGRGRLQAYTFQNGLKLAKERKFAFLILRHDGGDTLDLADCGKGLE